MPVYLFQRSTRYYLRTHIPEDLHHLFKTAELRYSLKTSDLRKARHRSRLIISFIHSMYRTLKAANEEDIVPRSAKRSDSPAHTAVGHESAQCPLSPEKLKEIVRKFVIDALEWEEKYQSEKALDPYEHEKRLQELENIILHHKEIVGEGQHRQEYRRIAADRLKKADINADPKSPEFNQLCRLMAQADVKSSEVALKWLRGDWSAHDKVAEHMR